VSIVGLYTWRNQLITELIPELYWDGDRSHLWSRLDYRRYPNKVWAIGPDAPDSSKESYLENRWRWQARIAHAIRGRLFLVGHFELLNMKIADVEPGGMLAAHSLPGSTGGFHLALGPGLLWDTRDHVLTPHDGEFYDVALMTSQRAWGSDFTFTTMVFDLRRYVPVTGEHVLAANLYVALQDGEAPFYQIPQLGGAELLRGYFEGRFRDATLATLQGEYRFPIYWRFSGVAFAGVGGVSRTLRTFNSNAPKWAVGVGLRFLLNADERLNVRADVGLGRDTAGFYVNVGEVF
jgi:outer membrane protein assembly factor BamA